MSYATTHTCAFDQALTDRITAAIADEQAARSEAVQPFQLLELMRWTVAAADDVQAAYASALAAGNPNPGGDEAVVTDGMILANVQANWPAS